MDAVAIKGAYLLKCLGVIIECADELTRMVLKVELLVFNCGTPSTEELVLDLRDGPPLVEPNLGQPLLEVAMRTVQLDVL